MLPLKEVELCCQSEQRGIIFVCVIASLSSILSKVSLQLHKTLKTVLKMGTGSEKHNQIEPNEDMYSCQYVGGFTKPTKDSTVVLSTKVFKARCVMQQNASSLKLSKCLKPQMCNFLLSLRE